MPRVPNLQRHFCLNTTAVVGRVDLVLVPTNNTGSNKTVSGTFNVAF